ncbi:DUF4855 domain-containing protein [Streptomyces melanogenes]|uniref:DUF4855 domain-containing protein n=1 Tax=Streptomyces melanogenes TaxID=67326 RepID=UPI0019CA8CDF|nr:DUF4855 domain-containing protein [Streptomyces melanogenes]GGP92586.1 hypothetical protein GCM10010278_83350 [Streptomyces melanogenes]
MILRRPMSAVLSVLAAFAAALSLLTAAAAPSQARAAGQWHRSMVVYHDANRNPAQWQHHLMRVAPNGDYTGKWLFDSAILTAIDYNKKDLMYGEFTGDELAGVLNDAFNDAWRLDLAAAALVQRYGAPPAKIKVSITMPWLNPANHSLRLPGWSTTLDLAKPDQRLQAADWYLDQIKSRAQAAKWQQLELYGAYYHREEILDATGDPRFVVDFNAHAHNRGLKTVWVPYFMAPNWDKAKLLGFDVSNVQPSQAFRSLQYGGEANDGRLYAIGAKSVQLGQAFEYEASSAGESQVENWAAHQYLAISQLSGASAFPQVFFTGLTGDMFDKMTTQAAAAGDRWWCYSDLADYLDGKPVANLEIGLPWPTDEIQPDGTRVIQWTPGQPMDLWAVRMDFTDNAADEKNNTTWRGRLTVKVDGPGGTRTSFVQRTGTTDFQPYEQVRCPLALAPGGDSTVTRLTLTLSRETGTSWPDITRLVANKYIVPVIANGATGEPSDGSYSIQPGQYADTADTHLDFRTGKLTDGQMSSTGDWNWPGVMGWNFYGGLFTITVDLGEQKRISRVELVTHEDQSSGITFPTDPVALIGRDAPARDAGTLLNEPAVGSSGHSHNFYYQVPGTQQNAGRFHMDVANVTGRYVTVLGHGSGWILLDEILVKDENKQVISTGKPYTVTPQPSVNQGQQTAYGDNSERLTNDAIAPVFEPQFSNLVDGIPAGTGGSVEVTWKVPRAARIATIWFTKPNPKYGVIVPLSGVASWRDQNGVWHEEDTVVRLTEGASPHATMVLPYDAQVTGVRAKLDATPGATSAWYMVSEITAR